MRPALALLLLALAGCGGPVSQTDGRAAYQALNCRACHRIGDEGSPSAPDLTYVGFRKSPQWLNLWLKDPQAWKPDAMMPNLHLTAPTRHALVQYLTQQKGQALGDHKPWDAPALAKDPVERGHVIFGRAGCITCHGKGGIGGYPNNNVAGGKIPALTSVWETYTKEELIQKITRGSIPQKADPAGPDPMIDMPPWGQVLSKEDIQAVAAYVMSLKPADAKSAAGF